MYEKIDYDKKNNYRTKTISETCVANLFKLPEFERAHAVYEMILQMHPSRNPKLDLSISTNWWNQINRSSMSIVFNLTEGYSKSSSYSLMIARGEAFETMAALKLIPDELYKAVPMMEVLKHYRSLEETVIPAIDKRISTMYHPNCKYIRPKYTHAIDWEKTEIAWENWCNDNKKPAKN